MHRYVVTGLGIICALGNNLDEVWRNAKQGTSGIGKVTKLDVSGCETKYAAELKDFIPARTKNRDRLDEVSLLALETACQAVSDAKLNLEALDKTRIGVVTGSCTGGIKSFERLQRDLTAHKRKLHPKDVLKSVIHVISGNIAHQLHLEGPTANIVNACAAGTISIAYGCSLIENGMADLVIVSGTDALGGLPFSGFYSLKSLDPLPCAPFSRSTGITLGEGAASLVIESYEHARHRQATIYCEVAGYGACSDAYHLTAPRPDGEGQIHAIQSALQQAGLSPRDIDYVNAHGTGTALNDSAEKAALQVVFANTGAQPSISSSKSMTGHCLGAAGAIEAVLAIKCLQENYVIPTTNFSADAGSSFDFVPNTGKPKSVEYVMSNSLAFGGDHASVVFGKRVKDNHARPASEKVFITGLGVVSPIGVGVQEYWDHVQAGRNGIIRVTSVNESDSSSRRLGGLVPIDDFSQYGIAPGALRKMDRLTKLLVTAGNLSMADAGLKADESNQYEIGVVAGTSDGPITETFNFQETMIKKGLQGGRAFVFPNTVYNAAAGCFSQLQGLKGYVTTFSNGILSGISSLGCSYDLLRRKKCQAMIAVGADEYSDYIHKGYELLGALDQGEALCCQPYSFSQEGFILGEGGCALTLETGEHAAKRGARCYAEVAGYGMAHSPLKAGKLDVQGVGLDRAIDGACNNAQIHIEDIDAIVGFGNGSSMLDRMELNAYQRIFGQSLSQTPVFTIKSYIGESRAAASALQIAHAALMLKTGVAPVTRRGYRTQYGREGERITLIEDSRDLNHVLVTGFAYGGGYAAVILRKVK